MKALVLLSGGLDSSTCLACAVRAYGADNVLALSVYYGQRHDREIRASEQIARYYGVLHMTLDLARIFEGSDCTLLKGASGEIPKESYAEQLAAQDGKPVSTYVPFRNGLFLASAASIALSHGCSEIWYGAHSDDAAGNAYPDCSEAFNRAMNDAVSLGSGGQLQIKAPFVSLTKADVVRKGAELGVPFRMTWSCYEGGARPCGICATCRDRIAAFAANGLTDPLTEEEPT